MKLVRIEHGGAGVHGAVEGDSVALLSGAPWEGGRPTGERLALSGARLLAPCRPTKVVCIGRNYAEHARELGNAVPELPLFFLKPPSAVIASGEAIVRPRSSQDVQHEAELGLVIGRRCRAVSEGEAPAHVWGITCVNDVTARDIQRARQHFTHAKGFDTFCPLGPLVLEGFPARPLRLTCRVNGAIRQDGTTADMVFSPAALVAYVSGVMTLEPGDVISTGTPAGVGKLQAGDVVEVEVEGVGILKNPVVNEE